MTIEQIKEKLKSAEYDFLRTNENLGSNIILLTLGGSHAYGMDKEDSDVDVRGISLNSKSDILLGADFEQVVDVDTDTTVYSFNKMIQLLTSNNPNTIEQLGCLPQHYFYLSEIGKELLDNRNYNVGAVDPELVEFGVAKIARLNCNGYVVDILEYVEEYENDNGQSVPYLPKGYATLLAPACGTTSYGAVNQIEEDGEWHTYAENRVPLILTDKKGQSKELRLAAAPLLMPNRHHAWITAKVIEA